MAPQALRGQSLATILLVALTAIWGSTFFLIRDLVTVVPAIDFLALRFGIAAVLMCAVFWRLIRVLPQRAWLLGVALGGLYGGAQILQTVGLEHTGASVSGFITGTYVVLTPLLSAAVLHERIGAPTWLAVALAGVGLGMLSLRGLSIGYGELLTLASAVLYAAHIIGLGRYSAPSQAAAMSGVQMATIAVMCAVAAVPGGVVLPQSTGQWGSVLYLAVFASVLALWMQTWAQGHLTATRAAIIMTLEPVFAAGFAVGLGGESLTARMVVGGLLVLAAMYLAELLGRRADSRPVEALHHEV